MTDQPKQNMSNRRLADVVRDVKIAAADRTDVVVDLRDADRARLELLAQELKPVFDDIDPADDRFDFGVSQGLQPRLWVDAVAHVHMGPDRRIFRFVRDTRLGRVVMSDTGDMAATADAVTRYIAERVIERERILAGDFESLKQDQTTVRDDDEGSDSPDGRPEAGETREDDGATTERGSGPDTRALASDGATQSDSGTGTSAGSGQAPAVVEDKPNTSRRGNSGFALSASWFILGCVAGAAALLLAFWDRLSALIS